MRVPMRRSFVGAVAATVTVGFAAPAAAADPPADTGPTTRTVRVDYVGDGYLAGEGLNGTYFDATDLRHQSRQSAPAQALARLAAGNQDARMDVRVAASSNAATAHFFVPQQVDGKQVNAAQRDQLRPDADLVLVGFGATDAVYNALLLAAVTPDTPAAGSVPRFNALMAWAEPLLSTLLPDQVYRDQAANSAPGQAPTLTARLIQVLTAVKQRSPKATVVVTNYPALVDAGRSTGVKELGRQEVDLMRDHLHRLNTAIDRAVRVCGCATLVDVGHALEGHEAFSADPAVNGLPTPADGQSAEHRLNESLHPNLKGATMLAGPLAAALARAAGLKDPGGTPAEATRTDGIGLDRAIPDRDGDGAPDPAPAAEAKPGPDPQVGIPLPDPKPRPTGRPGRPGAGKSGASAGRPASGGSAVAPVPVIVREVVRTVPQTIVYVVPPAQVQRPAEVPAPARPAEPAKSTPDSSERLRDIPGVKESDLPALRERLGMPTGRDRPGGTESAGKSTSDDARAVPVRPGEPVARPEEFRRSNRDEAGKMPPPKRPAARAVQRTGDPGRDD